MAKEFRSQLLPYGLAALSVILALLLTLLLGGRLALPPFSFFYLAVAIAAWYGGWRVGVLAAILAICVDSFILSLNHPFWSATSTGDFQVSMFTLLSLLLSIGCDALRRSRRQMTSHIVQLQESEERYRRLFETSLQPMWIVDAETLALLAVNDAALQLYGYAKAEFMSLTLTELCPAAVSPQRLDHPIDQWAAALGGGICQHHRRDGTPIDVRVMVQPANFNGRRAQLVLIHRLLQGQAADRPQAEQPHDAFAQLEHHAATTPSVHGDLVVALAELRTTQAELQHRNEQLTLERQRYQDLFDFAPDGYLVTDAAGLIQEANRAIADLLAIEQTDALLGQPLIHFIASSDLKLFFECLRQLQTQPQGQSWELYWQPRNRPAFPAELTVTRIHDHTGKFLGLRWLVRDITDRAQARSALQASEARLKLALEVGRTGTWDWNLHTDQVTWSEGHFTLLGLPVNACEPMYEHWADRVYPDDRAATEAAIQQALQTCTNYHHEYRLLWADGSVHWVEARGQFIYNPSGHPERMIGVLTDISDRKRTDQERELLLEREQAARAVAESANRVKDEFLAVLSHELRSPLNPILGWAKLLRERQFDAATTLRGLETIERNAKLQLQLIEDLLDVSRIQQGKLSLTMVPVNLTAVIEPAIETVRLAAEAKSIHIQTNFEADGSYVLGDPGRLQQVIWNLLSNAVKFTPNQGRIEVYLQTVDTRIEICVKDTGRGISADFLPYLFDYFRQADGTTTRSFGGLGLGLAIARHLVELHSGTIQAESPGENQGATFTVRLPLLQPTSNSQADLATLSTLPSEALPLARVQALVVDDEPDTRDFVTVLLQQAGAQVIAVASAPAALAALTQSSPDILLSDIGMPMMNGYELMRQIRTLPSEQGGQIPAIALTAYAADIDKQEAIAAGFQRHLAKPIEPDTLITAIVDLLPPP